MATLILLCPVPGDLPDDIRRHAEREEQGHGGGAQRRARAVAERQPRRRDTAGMGSAGGGGLSRSRLLEFVRLDHDVVPAPDCARKIMVDFLEQQQGGYDTGCLIQVTVPRFTTAA
jgi:hypothetical protein